MPPSLVRARGARERRAFRRVVVASLARACVVACVIASRTAEAGLSDWSNARVGARSSRARLDDGTTVGASGGTELMARALEKTCDELQMVLASERAAELSHLAQAEDVGAERLRSPQVKPLRPSARLLLSSAGDGNW